jgi:hypothetical protein
MATTPNIPAEQIVKQTIRQNSSAASYMPNPLQIINAATTPSGLYKLVVTDTTTAFTISGSVGGTTFNTAGLTGASTVGALVSGLAAVIPSTIAFSVIGTSANLLGQTSTDIVFTSATGASLPVLAASGTTATVTNINISTASGTVAYPNYYGTPNSVPTWIDDATVHAYNIVGNGAVVQDTTTIVQQQVRQIRTGNGPDGGLETQQWTGYFNAYQSNLNQLKQKNTKQQQC